MPGAGVPSRVRPKDIAPRLHALVDRGPKACGSTRRRPGWPGPGLPDLGFAEVAWRWARGERLARVLERAELAPGDFVRNAKQLVDLLRQLATVAPDPATAASAHRAASALQRGVVATALRPAVASTTAQAPTALPRTLSETGPGLATEGPETHPGGPSGTPGGTTPWDGSGGG